jgi:hypothetical protein
MVIFPMSGVLRGFPPSTYCKYASGENPCAAPAKMSGISHLIYKMKVLSFSAKKYFIYEL